MASARLTIDIWTDKGDRRAIIPRDLSDLANLLAPHVQHVASLCDEGFHSGEIVGDRFSGWWKVERS